MADMPHFPDEIWGQEMVAPLDGERSCLIVEDETLIAMLIEEAVAEMGLSLIGPVSRVSRALELLESHSPSCAVLDINVAGEPVHPVAQILVDRGIPFLFVSGYGEAGLGAGLPARRVIEKPFAIQQLQSAIRKLLEEADGATRSGAPR